jgi:hypothetical protein
VKLIMEIPDECAGDARRCMAWLEETSYSSAGKVLSVFPGGNPLDQHLLVRLMSMSEAVDYTGDDD